MQNLLLNFMHIYLSYDNVIFLVCPIFPFTVSYFIYLYWINLEISLLSIPTFSDSVLFHVGLWPIDLPLSYSIFWFNFLTVQSYMRAFPCMYVI